MIVTASTPPLNTEPGAVATGCWHSTNSMTCLLTSGESRIQSLLSWFCIEPETTRSLRHNSAHLDDLKV